MLRTSARLAALSLVPSLFAQEGAPTAPDEPAPAVVLLLREAPQWQVDALRGRMAKVLGTEVLATAGKDATWLGDGDHGMVGSHRGVRFRILASASPFELAASMLGHLDDGERAALRAHRAHAVVEADPGPPASAPASYRALGGVAASLLDGSVLGIGARHHRTFESVDGDTLARLLGEDPLAALEARVATSLVVVLKAGRKLDEKQLRAALAKELDVRISDAPDATDNFVVGSGDRCVIKVDGRMVMVSVLPRSRYFDEVEDAAARERLRGHRATLHAVVFGPPSDEAERRRLVARVVAALWDEDCLAINWHCSPAIELADEHLPAKLRKLDPVVATVGNPVVLPDDEAAMAKAIERARETWPEAVQHHAGGGEVSAKFPFAARSGGHEHIWISVTKIDGGRVHGTIANDPADLEGLRLGSPVECELAELSDWLFVRDGQMVGGFTVKLLQEQAGREPRKRAGR